MKEKDLPIDLTKHKVYSKNAQKCVMKLLRRYYDVLPVLCNSDHLAMRAIHASLIREGTCVTSDCCDYCIVGDKNPIAKEYELTKTDNGLWISEKTRHPKET